MDKVFLLSIAETEKYFRSIEERKCAPTGHVDSQGRLSTGGIIGWLLRSPGQDAFHATGVDEGGWVLYNGPYGHLCFDNWHKHYAVRPALWINLES